MHVAQTPDRLSYESSDLDSKLHHLHHVIEHAGHLLPAQGPITVFVHHNTLHAFEDLPFDEAVRRGGSVFGCHPYLPEERYRQKLDRGRIQSPDLEAVLVSDLGERATDPAIPMTTRLELRRTMLQYPMHQAGTEQLRWFVAETDALHRMRQDVPAAVRERFVREVRHWVMRDVRGRPHPSSPHELHGDRRIFEVVSGLLEQLGESSIEHWSESTWETFALKTLWRVCREGVHGLKSLHAAHAAPIRHRDALFRATGQDSDSLVHDLLIRYCAAFIDQGFTRWPIPMREAGFYRAFLSLYQQSGGPPDLWLRDLARELKRLEADQVGPLECILESLELLGVGRDEWDDYLTASLLALRGWAGMIRQVELRADRVAVTIPAGSLVEFLAVRLLLDRFALRHEASESLGYRGPLNGLRHAANAATAKPDTGGVDQRAFLVFQLGQLLGWAPHELHRLSKPQWATLMSEIEAFSGLERRRLFQLAFERNYRIQVLDALSIHAKQTVPPRSAPKFQVVTCLDEREESFRRHLEEVCPQVETFGAAGFYSVAMYYRGAADANFVPLCPVIIRPQHWVVEDVVFTLEEAHRRRALTRRALGTASHQVHVGSRTFAGGALLAAGLGLLASIPLVMRVLFPRITANIRRTASRFVEPPPLTKLRLERTAATPGDENDQIGFDVDEMANIGERLLRDIGLTSEFARLVVVLGHGSNSMNNPHKSAYDCGACGGGAGGPNARALAQILNDARVRERLAQRSINIPSHTVFVGGFHNTCNDAVTCFDLDRLPHSHQADYAEIRAVLDQTCDRNAHERCRRFMSAPLTMSFPAARRHVESRSEDLAQTRPECGHATNAVCFVGRRSRTRGLYMDRRAFLTSYDPAADDADASILTRILQAVFPVCAGINLEYYFSYVDPSGWGCGTKLPHNVTSLLGIMDGAASDLRPGLPWQMVEIHEPIRLLIVVESTPDIMQQIMARNPGIDRLVRNGWVQVATICPNSAAIHVFQKASWERYRPEKSELPGVATSVDWYRGWRDHLGFAEITGAAAQR